MHSLVSLLFLHFFFSSFSFHICSLEPSFIDSCVSLGTFDRLCKRVHNIVSFPVAPTRINPLTHSLCRPIFHFSSGFQENVAVARTMSKRICRTFCGIAHRKINNTKNIESRKKNATKNDGKKSHSIQNSVDLDEKSTSLLALYF